MHKISFMVVIMFCSAAAGAILYSWITFTPDISYEKRLPDLDGKVEETVSKNADIKIGEFFQKFETVPDEGLKGEWIGFRGEKRDNIAPETNLADTWPHEGPPRLWSLSLGQGYAAPAVYCGRVFILDYFEKEGADALRCFSLADGKEIWRRWYKVKVKNDHGMSRTVPAVSEKYTVTIGPMCHVMCVDTMTGDLKWGLDLISTYGSKRPPWHTAQCPLIDGDTAVIAPAGKDILMMGVDCETGAVIWQTPNPDGWDMSHSSIMVMTLNNTKMYIYAAIGGMVGISAEPDDRGTILWKTTAFDKAVIAPSPLVLDKGKVLLTAGYGAGSMLLQVIEENDVFRVKVLQEFTPKEGLASEQQTPIYYKGYVFSINPKDGGSLRKQFVCYSPEDLKNIIFSSGREHRFGLGPYIVADNKFYILDDRGNLTMAGFSSSSFQVMDQAQIMKGHESWGPIAIAGTRMLVRDLTTLICVDIGKNNE